MLLKVPPIVTDSGMTLYASPPFSNVTDTTAASRGSVSRETSCWRLRMAEDAAITGSMVS
uniref:Uncharacterized protein n=1 Tax=Arundo donax TaxID=35708 RepID=A0A0A9BG51_ARUDO